MTASPSPVPENPRPAEPLQPIELVVWADAARAAAFDGWLASLVTTQRVRPDTVRLASADASFRRYFRIDTDHGVTRIVMDAPPDKEDSTPFVKVAGLMREAGVTAPEVLDWNQQHGFLLLDDLGQRTMLDIIDPADANASRPRYDEAIDALIRWQLASRPDVLPPYDRALLERELALFPQWYITEHRGMAVTGKLQELGGIRYARGLIRIVERATLLQRSCECYAIVAGEFAGLARPLPGSAGHASRGSADLP